MTSLKVKVLLPKRLRRSYEGIEVSFSFCVLDYTNTFYMVGIANLHLYNLPYFLLIAVITKRRQSDEIALAPAALKQSCARLWPYISGGFVCVFNVLKLGLIS